MSRRSHAFAEGVPAFSWKVEAVERDEQNHGTRFLCTCKNHPAIKAFGDSEQEAIRAASAMMERTVDNSGLVSKNDTITPTGIAAKEA